MKFMTAAATLFAGLTVAVPATKTPKGNFDSLAFWAAADNTSRSSIGLSCTQITFHTFY